MSAAPNVFGDRARLLRIPLAALDGTGLLVTISVGEPIDALHEAAIEAGGVLLEVDGQERPVAAYRGRGRLMAKVAS